MEHKKTFTSCFSKVVIKLGKSFCVATDIYLFPYLNIWMFAICQAMFGLPSWLKWLGTCLQCLRSRFNPWVEKIPWRREWQSTPAFLPGESHGQRSLVGYSPWSHKDSDTPEWLTHTHAQRPFLFPFLLYFWWRNGKESTCQCRRWKRRGFHSWIGKIPWRRERQPTPVVLLGKFREQRCLVGYSAVGCQDQGTTERRSTYASTTTTGPWCPRVIGEGTWLQELVLGKGTADPCQNWRLEVRSSQVQGRAWNAGGFPLLETGDSFLSAGCSFLPPGLTASKTRETWLNAWMTDGSHVYNWAESVSSKKTQEGGKRNLEMRNKRRQRPRRERGFLRLILRAHVDWWLVGTSRWVLLFNLQKKVTKQELLLSPLLQPPEPK